MLTRVLTLLLAFTLYGLALADEHPFETEHACAGEVGNISNCTANDIAIAKASRVTTFAESCVLGEMVEITGIEVLYELNASQRYDPLLWVGTNGNDPTQSEQEVMNSCFVSAIPEPLSSPNDLYFMDLEENGDTCLDIENAGSPIVLYDQLLTVPCQDSDGDMMADIQAVVTWLQNTSLQCGPGSFGIGAPSKCNLSAVSLNIPVIDPRPKLTIIKNVINDDGGLAVSAAWNMDITGGNPSLNNFPGAPAPGVTVKINADEAYSVDESGGPDGYSKTLSAGCSGTLASGEMATCIITNDDIAPELTIIKDVVGGPAIASDWIMIVTASNPSINNFPGAPAPGVKITIDANIPYSVDEGPGPDNYVKTIGPGCSGTLLLGLDEPQSCTITNTFVGPTDGTLTIIKEVINDDGGTAISSNWIMHVNNEVSPSSNDFPGVPAPGVTISIDANKPYIVTESSLVVLDGYSATFSAGCSGILPVNGSATCTIVNNDDPAELTVIKQVVNDGGGTAVASDWTMDISETANPSNNHFPGSEEGVLVTIDSNTLYNVDESGGPDGYFKERSDGCDGTLQPGGEETCTITNTYGDDAPKITLRKVVINDNGGDAEDTDWVLFANGPIVIEGTEGSGDISDALVFEGDYHLGEKLGPDGYELVDLSCVGGTFDEETFILSLVLNDDVTCTFTNDDIAPELTVIKDVFGGPAMDREWDMVVTASHPSDNNFDGSSLGVTITIDANADYSVDEVEDPYVTEMVEMLKYVKSRDAGCFGNLPPGGSATCTITNTYIVDPPPVLTLLKDVINEIDGVVYGKHPDTEWTLKAAGPVIREGMEGDPDVTSTAVFPGSYILSEDGPGDGPEGYLASVWQCDGGVLDTELSILTLVIGDDVTCTITNTVIPPELKLIKVVIDGPGDPDDFGISVGNDVVLSGEFNQYPAHEPLEINENGYPGYLYLNISGDDKCPLALGGTVSLEEGEDISCTITNQYYPVGAPFLTLEKEVINDDGGNHVDTDWLLIADGVDNLVFRIGVEGSPLVTHSPVLPGTYKLLEYGPLGHSVLEPPGYLGISWSCEGGVLIGNELTLIDDDDVTCTVTNDDIRPKLTLTKVVDNSEGGEAGVNDFGISVDGNEVMSGETIEYLANNPMPINENLAPVALDGYIYINISGDDVCSLALGGTVSLDEGQDAECFINNKFHPVPAPKLTLKKEVINDDGGDRVDTDFVLIADGQDNQVFRMGIEGSPLVTASEVLPGTYKLSEELLPGYQRINLSCNGGTLNGDLLTLVDDENVTCTFTNDDKEPDISVVKSARPTIPGCPAVIGQQLDFRVTVNNQGFIPANGVTINDQWSPGLGSPVFPSACDLVGPELFSLVCDLGSLPADSSVSLDLGFMVSGNPGDVVCNTATVSKTPAETINVENNESMSCLDLVSQLELGPDNLPIGLTGVAYSRLIDIAGGVPGYAVNSNDVPMGFTLGTEGNQIRIQGCADVAGEFGFSATVIDNVGEPAMSLCQDVTGNYNLYIDINRECKLSSLDPRPIERAGIPIPDMAMPDESAQKLVVDDDGNRYLVGYTFNQQNNYDIRVTKFSDQPGENPDITEPVMEWDKTYDTGSYDLGYAITLNPAGDRLYVGGTSMMEAPGEAWWDAVLLEIDPVSGCLLGEHFDSDGFATSSSYYDIAADEQNVYAVGERQVNEDKPGNPGGLISIFNQQSRQSADICGDRVTISDTSTDELVLDRTIIRSGVFPTAAYSVTPRDCDECGVYVGGAEGFTTDGWVDILDPDGTRNSFLTSLDISVQDVLIAGDNRIVIAGSSAPGANDMMVFAYNQDGDLIWSQSNLGKGRMRAVASDDFGMVYAVGKSMESNSQGLLFKFNVTGTEIDRKSLPMNEGLSFHDVAIFEPGSGVIVGEYKLSADNFNWIQIDFSCKGCDAQQ